MLLALLQELMARDVLTRLRWWRRLSMTMLFSVTTAMTRDVTPLMSPTMSLNRKRTVIPLERRSVELNMSLNVGPSRRFMM